MLKASCYEKDKEMNMLKKIENLKVYYLKVVRNLENKKVVLNEGHKEWHLYLANKTNVIIPLPNRILIYHNIIYLHNIIYVHNFPYSYSPYLINLSQN